MATQNFFALLGEDDTDDISGLIARVESSATAKEPRKKHAQAAELPPPAKLPVKPPPPAQAVRENQSDGGRARGGRNSIGRAFPVRGRGLEGRPGRDGLQADGFQGGHGGFRDGPFNSEFVPIEEREGGRPANGLGGQGRGRGRGRRRGFDGEYGGGRGEYDRRRGTGRGNELKREGSGRGNWGSELDQSSAQDHIEENIGEEKPVAVEDHEASPTAEATAESEEKKKEQEEEEKEMTLEEYERLLSEKRKGLDVKKSAERKVDVDEEFQNMQLVDKKADDDVFQKLGADKAKLKEVSDKEEKTRKHVSINEFLKPADGEYYSRRGRGGRGRGSSARGGYNGSFGANSVEVAVAPCIDDPGQFPTLGSK